MQLKQPKETVLNVNALLIYFPAAFKKKCPHHKVAVDREMVGTSRASNYLNFHSARSRVADPDLDWIRIQSGQWIRIRIQEGKMTHKSRNFF